MAAQRFARLHCAPEQGALQLLPKEASFENRLEIDAGSGKKPVQRAMEGHILAQGELMGRYAR
jgi:phosphatidylethanolamine-binding protein (PEBP) family uncharacterized protein